MFFFLSIVQLAQSKYPAIVEDHVHCLQAMVFLETHAEEHTSILEFFTNAENQVISLSYSQHSYRIGVQLLYSGTTGPLLIHLHK